MKMDNAKAEPITISHITLNTGDIAMVPRSFLTDHAELAGTFAELVRAGGGPIPAVPHIDFTIIKQPEDAATISINVNATAQVVATLCYGPCHSNRWWQNLCAIYDKSATHRILSVRTKAALVPPRTPWLGVVLFDSVGELDAGTQRLLATIEENIAIAYLELCGAK